MEGGEDDNENDKITLLDLPEPVLLHIFSYLDLNFLRHVAPKVSVAFRELKVTPYLTHLHVACYERFPEVESAVVATRCRVHKLSFYVDNYNPKWVLMLQRHPEIKELELGDTGALDDEFAASVGHIVGAMVPRLISLDLSNSSLLNMPVTGCLLSAFSHQGDTPIKKCADWAPADQARHYPAGSEPTANPMKVECEDTHRLDQGGGADEQGRGLQRLRYKPIQEGPLGHDDGHEETPGEATAAHNLAALILGNCNSLRDVEVHTSHREVLQALARCTRLEKLMLRCDERGEAVRATLEAMAQTSLRTLRSLHLFCPLSLRAEDLAVVLQTLGRLEARIDTLTLVGMASTRPTTPTTFPGFPALAGLLVESGRRREPPCLRVLTLDDMAPVGRLELAELIQLTRPREGDWNASTGSRLSLRRLELSDCVCSAGRSWGECRDRCDEALQRFVPDLEVVASNRWLGCDDRYDVGFMPMYTCDCERRRPPPPNRRGRGRGGH
ncbi:UvrABC system protein C [Frankliniella fusca]|uniref:UvrABC system protein C n=1 Tax=Frankliniella fusca TaxID=407009 RepID=A0AAE1LGX6_9NEOP|nr:UvrABC system protein C [Frankliniella fusca]